MTDVKRSQKKELGLSWSIVIFLIMQTVTAVWWAAQLTSDVRHLQSEISEKLGSTQASLLQIQIDNNHENINKIDEALLRIENKIDQLR